MEKESMKYMIGIRQIKENFGFDFVSMAMPLNANYPLLAWMYAVGNLNRRYSRIVLESGKGIAGGVHKAGRAMLIQNISLELTADNSVEYPITISEKLASMFAVPMWKSGKVEGVLMMAFRAADRITLELFQKTMTKLIDGFCGFEIHSESFDDALRPQKNPGKFNPVPVYELMNHHIIGAQEDERRRIAQDLHDSTIQQVLGAQMMLRSIKYQKSQEDIMQLVNRVERQLGQVQDELRSIVESLMPMALDDFGLAPAIRSHFKWMENCYGLVVHFQHNGNTVRYVSEIEIVFYRVCQEAVLNAYKYSGCDEIQVFLYEDNGCLVLEVIDKGVGFDPEDPEIKGTGIGLFGMMERAELIGAEWTCQSAPGKGTRIRLAVTLEKEAEE